VHDPCDRWRDGTDKDIAPTRDRCEWRRQTAGCVKKHEAHTEHADGVHADEER
jgi:hypothetical protein